MAPRFSVSPAKLAWSVLTLVAVLMLMDAVRECTPGVLLL